ncbi:AAA family ATPase [Enterococcus casseliflavus]|uniref:ATP-binding protein n=1 Tax=Enterococcus casseliflavus TaxID=37734 RepID=UPI0023D7C76D|nr:AAA family ATPase [Enterococcus casseliflavus]WEI92483.1 AAA family ATPase [Enterococcus casseliflavus]
MIKQKINKIYLKNFKHIDEAEVNFCNNDLIVLDGPNGFGKTTIFDAVELVMTGKISRITNTIDGRLGYEYTLFSNNHEVDTEVRVEFDKGGEKIVIAKRIDSQKSYTQIQKRPDNWNIFQTYRLPELMSTFDEGEKISNSDVEEILDISDLERFFNLFYYVQQEENTLFLKKSGKDRMEAISSLFDTKEEEKELLVIKKAKKKITSRKEAVRGQLKNIRNLLDDWMNELEKIKKGNKESTVYFKLLASTSNIEWDKEDVNVDITTREKYINELRSIYKLRINVDDFFNTQFNNQIDDYLSNNQLLLNTIDFSHFLERHDDYISLKAKEKSIRRLENAFTKTEIKNNLDISIFEDIDAILQLSLDIPEVKRDLENLKIMKSKMTDFSSIVQQFKETRKELLNNFSKIKQPIDRDCPLCGVHFDSYDDLLKSIQEKEYKFEKMTDYEGKLYEKGLDNFYVSHVTNIEHEIKKYFSESENIIPDVFYTSLTLAAKMKDQVFDFIEWCKTNDIELDNFINTDSSKTISSETKLQELTQLILSKKKNINSGYKDHEDKKFIFENIFNSNEIELRKVELESISRKADYLNSLFYNNGSKKIEELKLQFKKNEIQEEELSVSEGMATNIIDVYENEISKHWRKIIRDIEIPFYIYSGKIIQNYQLGCGLFIREKDNYEKSIMFVSGVKNDHDAINYLSSGQLSGLVIAFTLALNKVYEKKSLGVLLIDDPVQTMDEINIASFVELLRNDFSQKQIVLSTHEEEISKYIRYKFSKYGLKTKRINVKNHLYK